MSEENKQKLIVALTNRGYSWIDAKNVAYGDPRIAEQRFMEYCVDPVDDFFNQWLNKPCDFDHVFGNQCTDEFKFYNRDVVKAPAVSGNAIAYWTNYPIAFYTRIENTWTAVARKGDVIIWAASKALPYGHISICKSASWWGLTSMDQNWPVRGYYDDKGNFIGTGTCHFVNHNYLSPKIIGWLRPNKLA